VVVVHATRFDQAEWIVHHVRERKTVLVHAGAMEPSEAQRLIDFVAGGVSALDGQAEGLDALTFVFAPEIVALRREAAG
jgi:cell division inhibitor SepF